MENLLITLLVMSSVASLNPIGITQQFILQGMVKKPRHIWYFIITTGIVNIIFGYLVYYGVMTLINNRIDYVLENYGAIVYSLEIALALLILFFAIKSIVVHFINKKKGNDLNSKENEIKGKIRSVTPLALIAVGVVSTVSELTSAVPYFAFLAVLVKYQLPFMLLTLIFILYNIIYIMPFVILYVIYVISKNSFDKIYNFFKTKCKTILEIALPLLFFIIGAVILYDGIANLIHFL